MKLLISILIGLLVVGCGKEASTNKIESVTGGSNAITSISAEELEAKRRNNPRHLSPLPRNQSRRDPSLPGDLPYLDTDNTVVSTTNSLNFSGSKKR